MAKGKTVRQRLLKEVECLSDEKVEVLTDMAAFLREREDWEATYEILANKKLLEAVQKSKVAWAKGKRDEFVPIAKLKEGAG
jgi:hypothetical protein